MSMANTRKPKSRKERSEKFLRENGVMTDPALPELPDENNAVIKPLEEAVKRAVCALLTARIASYNKSDSEAVKLCADLICRFRLVDELTADEKKYFALAGDNTSGISDKKADEFHWRSERSMPLLWACGFLGERDLDFPSQKTNTDEFFYMLSGCQSFPEVMSKVKMHTVSEILDNADVCFRMYGACVAAKSNKTPMLRGDLMSKAVNEQLKGFCWLIGLGGADNWDKIDI